MEIEDTFNTTKKMSLSSVNTKRCKYYNRGYCKQRENCKFLHPTEECALRDKCINNCLKRHRKICRYGIYGYHNKHNVCEFLHGDFFNIDNKNTNSNNIREMELEEEVKRLENQIEDVYKKEINKLKKYMKDMDEYATKLKNKINELTSNEEALTENHYKDTILTKNKY